MSNLPPHNEGSGGPNAYGPSPYGPQYFAPKPDNALIWTIRTTVLCCLPLGAEGIYFSTQVDKLWANGDHMGAEKAAKNARLCAILSAVSGPIIIILAYVVLIAVVIGVGTN